LTPKSPTDTRRDGAAGLLLQHVLTRWTRELARQLALMAQGGGVAVEHVCQHVRASHEALLSWLGLVERTLVHDATAHCAPARFAKVAAESPGVRAAAGVVTSPRSAAQSTSRPRPA